MYKIILAIRYLVRRRISYFSVAATALCVFVVFVVITVLSGLTAEFKTNMHRAVGDCVVSSKSMVGFGYYEEFVQVLNAADFVEAVSPVIKSYAIVDYQYGTRRSGDWAVEIIGVDPTEHSCATSFGEWLQYDKGNIDNVFVPPYDPNLVGCVPGVAVLFDRDSEGSYEIAEELPRVKFEVSSFPLTARGALAKAGVGEVNTKTFYCSDVARSGLARADGNRIYLPFEDAQMLCGMGTGRKRVNGIHIKFKRGVRSDTGRDRIAGLWQEFVESMAGARGVNLLENVDVQTWKTYSRVFVAAVETEQAMMIFIFGMIGIITVFIVFVVFYMIVSHKSKDIGILKSIGASSASVLVLFLGFAFMVGVVGSAIGAVGGWQFLLHINQIEDWLFEHFEFQLWDRRLYAIGDIPNAIDLKVLAGIMLSAIFTCFVGAVVPSWQAARCEPVDTLRVNQL
jgi:lipoprotein-releasing system permease protein